MAAAPEHHRSGTTRPSWCAAIWLGAALVLGALLWSGADVFLLAFAAVLLAIVLCGLSRSLPRPVERLNASVLQHEWDRQILQELPRPAELLPDRSDRFARVTGVFPTTLGVVGVQTAESYVLTSLVQ